MDPFPSRGVERGKGSLKDRWQSPVPPLYKCCQKTGPQKEIKAHNSKSCWEEYWNHTKLAEVGAPKASPHWSGPRVALWLRHLWAEGPGPSTWRDGGVTKRFLGLLEWSKTLKGEPALQEPSCQCWGGELKHVKRHLGKQRNVMPSDYLIVCCNF